jgi:glycosyltransferase involved in cell wall biosynthesis
MSNNNYDLKFSICMPVYNGEDIISQTLRSILTQSFDNFEIIIVDDCSKDNTFEVIKSLNDKRIKYFKNEKNLGYPKNLEECRKKANGDIIYLMAQDDILAKNALLNTYKAFRISDDIGAVTRPYFWFDKNFKIPVRAKNQLNPYNDEIIDIKDAYYKVIEVFRTLDQLSGLAFRRNYIDTPFHKDIFPCHVYPFASIFKKYKVVFLKDYNVAVRINSSQTRSISSIYDKSPVQSWKDMFDSVFYEDIYKDLKNYLIRNFVMRNFIGLVQLRNFGRVKYLFREIYLLLKYRWQNFFNFFFWVIAIGCIITPPALLIKMVDYYKNKINYKKFRNIRFNYEI